MFTAHVESVAAGGRGVCRVEGRAVFMAFTAPGDTVTGRITAERPRWAEAELVELNEASPLRVKPPCPYYGTCGGCSLQHVAYGAQLDIKKTILAETFIRAGLRPPPVTAEPSPPYEYRNRVSLHVARQGGVRAGFKARKSADVVPVRDCLVADPAIRAYLRDGAPKSSLKSAPETPDRFTVYAKDGTLLSETGKRRSSIRLGGKCLVADAGLFFQSNAAALEKLVPYLRAAAAEHAPCSGLPMADLYAGVGTFSLFLADLFDGADVLEENGAALELARHNLAALEAGRVFRYRAERAETWVRRRGKRNYGFAVVDPPRVGLSSAVSRWLAGRGPPFLAYVSCDAASLARDSRLLSSSYALERLTLFDFYPQTAHIESLALFRRKMVY
jgi:23S rRNA (uracil1939-C5)-methyltransferase